MAKGAYSGTVMLRVFSMYTPQVFQGTRAEVTVPAPSRAEDRTEGCRPILRYSSAYIRPGTTMEMYCSGMVMLDSTQVTSVTVTRAAGLLASFLIWLTTTSSWWVPSIMPPNIMAMMVIATEDIMPRIPPLSSRVVMVS